MLTFFRKYQVHIMASILGVFVIYIGLMGVGASIISHGSPNDSIVDVDGEKVPLKTFYSHYNRAIADIKTPLDANAQKQKREETLRDLVQAVIFKREAKRYGIVVPDIQVATSLTQIPAFQTKGAFDPQLYMRTLAYQLKATPEEFEEEQRQSIAFFKLRWLIQSSIKVTDKQAELVYAFQHKDSMAGFEKDKETFRQKIWQDQLMDAFNQWFMQINQKLRVKPHMELLDGAGS